MRATTTQRLTAAAVASLALFGAACSDDAQDEMGELGEEVEQDVENGAEDLGDAAEGQDDAEGEDG